MSERRACRVIDADRKSVRYRSTRGDDADLREKLRELANQRRRFGYRRLHILLRREGIMINRKKTQRLYKEEGLAVRRRRSRKRAVGTRAPAPVLALPNQRWSLDFVHDQMASGRRFRVLNVVDMTVATGVHCLPTAKFFTAHSAMLRSQDKWLAKASSATASQQARWKAGTPRDKMRAVASDIGLYDMLGRHGLSRSQLDNCFGDPAVYQPITDETFWAEKSRGAWLHDGRLRVSGRRNLSEALIANPRTSRVSRGSMMPSSHNLAVE